MDPLTAATTFATIVGLICSFRSERGSQEALSHQDFVEWLDAHRHEEIKNLICNTFHLQQEVDQLLRANHEQVLAAVNQGNSLLVEVLARLDAFAPMAAKIFPTRTLSDQAISILRQLRASGAPEVGYAGYIGGFRLIAFSHGNTLGELDYSEPLLVKDDLHAMTEMGLLRFREGSRGTQFFGLTRAALQFLDALPAEENGSVVS